MEEKIKMEPGKMYYIAFGPNTCLVVRFKEEDTMNYHFYSHLHYWNQFEKFHSGGYCIKGGITEIRQATCPEKHHLFMEEIENDCV